MWAPGPLSGVHARRGRPGRLPGCWRGMNPSGWIGDKGYVGRGMITPHKKPPNGELDEKAKEENKSDTRIRQVVERTIAHIRSWRIHPHRLQEILGNIRADHHRSTRTLRLQNHPLNKFSRRARHTGGDY